MNRSTINRKYGLKPSLPSPHHLRFEREHKVQAALPTMDTSLVPYSPVAIDQMQVGMCTGAGTSRALKNYLASESYKWPFMPSALDIYQKVRTFEGVTDLTQDTGASIADVFTVINTMGVCPEDSNAEWSWPFSASDDRWTLVPPPACEKDAALHKVIKYMKVNPDPDSIKSALFQGFPLVIGISVFKSFESDSVAKTGIIPMPGFKLFDPLMGGHCLRVDAFGMFDPDHVDGINSWGPWGSAHTPADPNKGLGRFHLPFKYLCNTDLTSDIWAIEVMD